MKSKKYYACFIPGKDVKRITDNWNDCEKLVSGVKGARYRSFNTRKEAEEWLASGAKYKEPGIYPHTKRKASFGVGVYFDAGTGRGEGVEISLTNEKGEDLLDKVLPKKKINKHGKHLIVGNVTNNYGELLAASYALKLALKEGVKKIFGDSRLVIDYWSKGAIKRKELPAETVKLADKVLRQRKEFEASGGEMLRIPGSDNPADLGFHR